jgi:acetyl esterase/lipase
LRAEIGSVRRSQHTGDSRERRPPWGGLTLAAVVGLAMLATGGGALADLVDSGAAPGASIGPGLDVDQPATDVGLVSLTDPIAPGACDTVFYTPPTSSRSLVGDLCRPEVTTEPEAILLLHGGGGTGGSRLFMSSWQDFYLAHGYVTFTIDYTLLDPALDARLYPLAEQNVKAAVQYLRMQGGWLGVERVVVQGNSSGARLGAVLLTTANDPAFAGPELWPGVSDAIDAFIGFYGYYEGWQFDAGAYYGGDGTADASARAVDNAAVASGPTLLFHSDADSIVPVAESESFAAALRTGGQPAELFVVDGEHGFDGYAQRNLSSSGQAAGATILVWLHTTVT